MKAKKSRGMKNKLYSERNQGQQVSDFQVISAVVGIYLLSFYGYLEANGY